MQATRSLQSVARRTLSSARVSKGRSYLRVQAFKEGGMADVSSNQAKPVSKPQELGDCIPRDQKVYIFKQGDESPKEVTTGEIFKGKKAVLFGLPGAYTSVCSSKHVPEYSSKAQELKQAGVDLIACTSINDAYVMRQWAEGMGVDQANILMVADGDGSFHRAMGLTQVLPGLGERARRYSMYLDDGNIKSLNIEEPGGMSYKVSGPSNMLAKLQELKNKA